MARLTDPEATALMNEAKANLDIAFQLAADGRLVAAAGRLATAQDALRKAEWRMNDIIRAQERSPCSP